MSTCVQLTATSHHSQQNSSWTLVDCLQHSSNDQRHMEYFCFYFAELKVQKDAVGLRSKYDVPRDLGFPIVKVPEVPQHQQRLPAHHLDHPHLLRDHPDKLVSHAQTGVLEQLLLLV